MHKIAKIISIIALSCIASISYAAAASKIIQISDLKPDTPEYVAIKYYQALQSYNFEEAAKYASKAQLAQMIDKLKGPNRQEGVIANLKATVFTEILVDESLNVLDKDRLKLSLFIRKNRDDGSLNWGQFDPRFLRIAQDDGLLSHSPNTVGIN